MSGKIFALMMALCLTAALFVTSIDQAEARRRHKGAVAAGIALGILGAGALAAGAAERDGCYRGELRCRWVKGRCYRDEYGDLECEQGYEKCYRPLYCD